MNWDWVERLQRSLPGENLSFIGELKIDGIAASIIYENGKLLRGATRNGSVGDEVTANLRAIRSIPSPLILLNLLKFVVKLT